MDQILMTVITNRLEGITREMGTGMLRSSRSPIFAENKDLVTAIFDKQLRLVAQTAYIPVLMGASPFAIKSIAEHFGEDIYQNDIIILNDPYRGNNHAPDITVVKPVFFAEKLRFWVFSRGHHADIGGGGAAGRNPHAKTVWEEGLRIPPAKLYQKGEYNRDLWEIILLNVRLPTLVEGDLQCQVGACNVGEKGLEKLLQRYGLQNIDDTINEVLKRSEIQMLERIATIPDGIYFGERQLDHVLDTDQPKRPTVRLKLEKKGRKLLFDFAQSDPQIQAYYNSSYANTVSSCYIGLFSTIAPDINVDNGSMQPVEVVAPKGSLVNPIEGAPTTQCTVATCATIVEAVWLALATAVPKLAQAGWARTNAGAGTAFNPRTGRQAAFILHFTKGGGGATLGYDGWNHISPVSSMGGSRVPDPELHELTFPHRILKYEFRPESAGIGQWRGGYGVNFSLRFIEDGTALAIQIGSGSQETLPFGLEGGGNAVAGTIGIRPTDGEPKIFEEATLHFPRRGDIVDFGSAGGGGFGNPYKRSEEDVLTDVTSGLLSIENAHKHYGVVVNPATLTIDYQATKNKRNKFN